MAAKSGDQVGQGAGGNKSSAEAKAATALQVHQQYEQLAKGLAAQGDQRLGSLADSLLANRQQQVGRFADVMRRVASGEVDLMLLQQALHDEIVPNEPIRFDVKQSPLADPVAALGLPASLADAKALGGF